MSNYELCGIGMKLGRPTYSQHLVAKIVKVNLRSCSLVIRCHPADPPS